MRRPGSIPDGEEDKTPPVRLLDFSTSNGSAINFRAGFKTAHGVSANVSSYINVYVSCSVNLAKLGRLPKCFKQG